MFWRVAGFTQPSPIETILDKENFTLEELLDEDDLIQVLIRGQAACQYQGSVLLQVVLPLFTAAASQDSPSAHAAHE